MATIQPPKKPAAGETPTETLLRLLPEFTASLKQLIMEADKIRVGRELYALSLALLGTFTLFGLLMIFFNKSLPQVPNSPSGPPYHDTAEWVMCAFGLTFFMLGVITLQLKRGSLRMSRFAVSNAATQLKGLVRTASQIIEYGETGFSQRLELNLRIAEAENVLLYASHYAKPNMSPSGTDLHEFKSELIPFSHTEIQG